MKPVTMVLRLQWKEPLGISQRLVGHGLAVTSAGGSVLSMPAGTCLLLLPLDAAHEPSFSFERGANSLQWRLDASFLRSCKHPPSMFTLKIRCTSVSRDSGQQSLCLYEAHMHNPGAATGVSRPGERMLSPGWFIHERSRSLSPVICFVTQHGLISLLWCLVSISCRCLFVY